MVTLLVVENVSVLMVKLPPNVVLKFWALPVAKVTAVGAPGGDAMAFVPAESGAQLAVVLQLESVLPSQNAVGGSDDVTCATRSPLTTASVNPKGPVGVATRTKLFVLARAPKLISL